MSIHNTDRGHYPAVRANVCALRERRQVTDLRFQIQTAAVTDVVDDTSPRYTLLRHSVSSASNRRFDSSGPQEPAVYVWMKSRS